MSVDREDLVGFALGALSPAQTEHVRQAVAGDAALARELKGIERHLRLHDGLPILRPAAPLWDSLRTRLDEAPARRPVLQRYWMPLAAAALVAAAFLWPARERPTVERLHGDVARTDAGTWSCGRISRVRLGDGVTLTLDADTTFGLPGPERLALGAGLVFLEVEPGRRGFTVEAGGLTVTTTGTAFLVQVGPAPRVWVESGEVRCTWADGTRTVPAGETFAPDGRTAWPFPSPRAWFQRPAMTARILDAETLRVVIRNDMPDPILVAPPTGGEPLFFATYAGHDYPLSPDDLGLRTVRPGTDESFLLRLPRPLGDREALLLSYTRAGVRVEATR